MPGAIVLAGGEADPRLAPDLPNKSFLSIGGRPLVVRVTDALRSVPSINPIIVVGPPGPLAATLDSSLEILPEGATVVDNIAAAAGRLAALAAHPRAADAAGSGASAGTAALAVAADLPLLTGEVIERFLELCTGDARLFYPIVPRTVIEQRYPGATKTYVTVADGTFAGGSVLLFDPRIIDRVRPLVERIMAGRKKPWLLAQLFGWSLAMKLFAGTLSIAAAEARVEEVTGIRGKAVVVDAPELALDIDAERPENVQVMRAVLEPGARSER